MFLPILQNEIEQEQFDESVNQDLVQIRHDLEKTKAKFESIKERVYPFDESDLFMFSIDELIVMFPFSGD